MTDEHSEAVHGLMAALERRLAAGPIVERRRADRSKPVEARRATGPVASDFAYWRSEPEPGAKDPASTTD
jgi:hypothetical protein